MNLFKTILIFNSASFLLAVCPSGFYEDDFVNCWLPYCYDYISHNMSYDSSEASCNGPTEMWVIPGEQGDPFFNNYFFKIPNSFMQFFIFSNVASILSSIPTDKRIIPLLNPISICSSSLISEDVLLPGKLNKVLK